MIRFATRTTPWRVASIAKRLSSDAVKYKYQDQLWLIPAEKNSALVSFSKDPSAISIGKVIDVDSDLKEFEVSNSKFEENGEFLPVLNKLLNDKVHNDFVFKTEAGVAPNSHMAIYDFRNPPQYGRTPDVDNVMGYVRVNREGEIIPHSYEPNPMYRTSSDADGLITLSDYLLEEIKEVI